MEGGIIKTWPLLRKRTPTMTPISYVLQFKGTAGPTNEAGTILKATTTAPGCQITTTIGPDGVTAEYQPAPGERASFESEVRITGESSFQEQGTISMGKGRLHFSTVGEGYLGASSDPKVRHGSVIWRIERGEGPFQGATGLITSNFFVTDQGEVTDNHFGVLFLR
jgi:hypothetical protein